MGFGFPACWFPFKPGELSKWLVDMNPLNDVQRVQALKNRHQFKWGIYDQPLVLVRWFLFFAVQSKRVFPTSLGCSKWRVGQSDSP